MKELETENANLKRMHAELALENAAIKELRISSGVKRVPSTAAHLH